MADPMTVSGLRHWRRLRQRRKRWWRWRRRAGAAVTAPHPGSSGTGRICALAHPSREPGRMCVWRGWAVRGRESRPAPRAQSGWRCEKRPLLPGPCRVSKPVGCASTGGLLARAPHSLARHRSIPPTPLPAQALASRLEIRVDSIGFMACAARAGGCGVARQRPATTPRLRTRARALCQIRLSDSANRRLRNRARKLFFRQVGFGARTLFGCS